MKFLNDTLIKFLLEKTIIESELPILISDEHEYMASIEYYKEF
jgi:hypothetical protein